MHVAQIVHQILDATIHKTRIESLIPILTALIKSKQLNLTQLGRSLDTDGKERSGIRRVDRLLANKYYHNNYIDIYKSITSLAAGNQGRPVILVDWSGVPNSRRTSDDGEHSLLRASLISEGRSITLYEEVHSKKKENNDKVHQSFLKSLKSVFSEGVRPYIVTDAGFKNPWFKAVLALNWDYIGRVRGTVHYDDGSGFKSIQSLFNKASKTPKSLGDFKLSKSKSLKTRFYVYKHQLKGKKKRTKSGTVDTHKDSINHSKGYREPWILISSLGGYSAVNRVVKIYKMRMTIELAFRDVKSIEFGLSMNENKTVRAQRYIVWFLLAALASLIAWIVGYAAEKQGLHYDFQANTYKHRRVLSFFYLGCQIIRKNINLSIDIGEIQREAWDLFSWDVLC